MDPTNRPPLSPAAQAVMDAMHRSYDHEPTRLALAAGVIRAAVAATQAYGCDIGGDHWICEAKELLAIAAELESHRG